MPQDYYKAKIGFAYSMNPLSSWISSAITSGYDYYITGIFQRRWFITLAKWVSRLTLNSAGATFASSVANSLAYNGTIICNTQRI
jgi:hypothetical protein